MLPILLVIRGNEQLISLTYHFSNALNDRMALAILRMPKGMDYSYLNLEVNHDNGFDSPTINQSNTSLAGTGDLILTSNRHLMHADSNLNLAGMASSQSTITTPQPRKIVHNFLENQFIKNLNNCSTTSESKTTERTN